MKQSLFNMEMSINTEQLHSVDIIICGYHYLRVVFKELGEMDGAADATKFLVFSFIFNIYRPVNGGI